MTTHWIPPFTSKVGGRQQAVCGDFVMLAEHSNEPTCSRCKAYVEAEASDTRTAEDVFGEPVAANYTCEGCGARMGFPAPKGLCWPCELKQEDANFGVDSLGIGKGTR